MRQSTVCLPRFKLPIKSKNYEVEHFLVMALCAIFFIGCSVDNNLDPIDEPTNLELYEKTISKAKARPFKVKGAGTFQIVAPIQCENLTQVLIDGQGNASHLGLFTVLITYCTDFEFNHFITGTMTAANGDELYFYSVGFGEDAEGQWTDYIYDGGTGRFENVTGELTMYGVSVFTSPTSGVYTNYGSGTLTY